MRKQRKEKKQQQQVLKIEKYEKEEEEKEEEKVVEMILKKKERKVCFEHLVLQKRSKNFSLMDFAPKMYFDLKNSTKSLSKRKRDHLSVR